MNRNSALITYLSIALLVVFAIYAASDIFNHPEKRQWDFKSYYYAAKAAETGANAYDPVELRRFSGDGHNVLPYVYPPPTLTFFRVFALFSYPVAYQIWLVFKLLLLAGLILIWRNWILPEKPALWFYLFIVFAFGATVYFDLVTGNITILEQFLLWLGCAFLLRARPLAFCICLLLASCFKITPIVFLLLLPAIGMPRAWRYLGYTTFAFASLGTISYLIDPAGWQNFFASLSAVDEPGILNNPSLLSLLKDLLYSIAAKWGGRVPGMIPFVFYLAVAALILQYSVRSWRAIRVAQSPQRRILVLFLFCITYALIMPRFKTYAFILLIPAAYFTICQSARMPAFLLLLALMSLKDSSSLPIDPFPKLFWQYFPYLLTLMIWLLLSRHIKATADGESSLPSTG